MADSDAETPWYREPHQWAWLAVAAVTVAAGIVLLVLWHQRRVQEDRLASASADVIAAGDVNAHLTAHLVDYEHLLDEYAGQKEQLIQQIADYSHQLDLLNRKTQRLERVRDELGTLNTSFDQFQKTEHVFHENLATLELTVKQQENGQQQP